MTTIEQEVFDFMDEHLGVYDNPHDVEITMNDGPSICISCYWPDVEIDEEICLGFCYDSDTIDKFVEDFGIRHVEEIDHITPALLFELYHQGKAEIYSALDTIALFYLLYYRKHENKIMAKNDLDMVHEVPFKLETPQQFIDYMQQHARIVNNPEFFLQANHSLN